MKGLLWCVYVCLCFYLCMYAYLCIHVHHIYRCIKTDIDTDTDQGWIGKRLQHLLGATKRAFSFFYLLWNSGYHQRFPLISTEIWRYSKQRFGVLKFALNPLCSCEELLWGVCVWESYYGVYVCERVAMGCMCVRELLCGVCVWESYYGVYVCERVTMGCMCVRELLWGGCVWESYYGVATVSRIDKITGLFCRI